MPGALMDLQARCLLFDRIPIAVACVHAEKLPFAVFGTQAEIAGLLGTTGNTRIDLAALATETCAPRIVAPLPRHSEDRWRFWRRHFPTNLAPPSPPARG